MSLRLSGVIVGWTAIEIGCRHNVMVAMDGLIGERRIPAMEAARLALQGTDVGSFKLYLDAFSDPAKIEFVLDEITELTAARIKLLKGFSA